MPGKEISAVNPDTCMSLNGMLEMSIKCIDEVGSNGQEAVKTCIEDKFAMCDLVQKQGAREDWISGLTIGGGLFKVPADLRLGPWDEKAYPGTVGIDDIDFGGSKEAKTIELKAAILTKKGFMNAVEDCLDKHGIKGEAKQKFLERAEIVFLQVSKKDIMVKAPSKPCPGLAWCTKKRKAGALRVDELLRGVIDNAVKDFKHSKLDDKDAAMLLAIESARNEVKKMQEEGANSPWNWITTGPKEPFTVWPIEPYRIEPSWIDPLLVIPFN